MKIILIGASGTIGKAILNELAPRHEIVKVGKTSGEGALTGQTFRVL